MNLPTLEQIALLGVCLMEAFFYFCLWRLRVILTARPVDAVEYEEQRAIVEEYEYPERPAYVATENKRAVVEYGAAVVNKR